MGRGVMSPLLLVLLVAAHGLASPASQWQERFRRIEEALGSELKPEEPKPPVADNPEVANPDVAEKPVINPLPKEPEVKKPVHIWEKLIKCIPLEVKMKERLLWDILCLDGPASLVHMIETRARILGFTKNLNRDVLFGVLDKLMEMSETVCASKEERTTVPKMLKDLLILKIGEGAPKVIDEVLIRLHVLRLYHQLTYDIMCDQGPFVVVGMERKLIAELGVRLPNFIQNELLEGSSHKYREVCVWEAFQIPLAPILPAEVILPPVSEAPMTGTPLPTATERPIVTPTEITVVRPTEIPVEKISLPNIQKIAEILKVWRKLKIHAEGIRFQVCSKLKLDDSVSFFLGILPEKYIGDNVEVKKTQLRQGLLALQDKICRGSSMVSVVGLHLAFMKAFGADTMHVIALVEEAIATIRLSLKDIRHNLCTNGPDQMLTKIMVYFAETGLENLFTDEIKDKILKETIALKQEMCSVTEEEAIDDQEIKLFHIFFQSRGRLLRKLISVSLVLDKEHLKKFVEQMCNLDPAVFLEKIRNVVKIAGFEGFKLEKLEKWLSTNKTEICTPGHLHVHETRIMMAEIFGDYAHYIRDATLKLLGILKTGEASMTRFWVKPIKIIGTVSGVVEKPEELSMGLNVKPEVTVHTVKVKPVVSVGTVKVKPKITVESVPVETKETVALKPLGTVPVKEKPEISISEKSEINVKGEEAEPPVIGQPAPPLPVLKPPKLEEAPVENVKGKEAEPKVIGQPAPPLPVLKLPKLEEAPVENVKGKEAEPPVIGQPAPPLPVLKPPKLEEAPVGDMKGKEAEPPVIGQPAPPLPVLKPPKLEKAPVPKVEEAPAPPKPEEDRLERILRNLLG